MSAKFNRLPLAARHAIYVAQLKKQSSPAENEFCRYLASLDLPYRYQQGFYKPYYRIVDFYLPDHNLIVEIDGPYHDAEEDRRKDEWFERERGIKIIRFTNDQVLSGDFAMYTILYRESTEGAFFEYPASNELNNLNRLNTPFEFEPRPAHQKHPGMRESG